MAGRSKGFLRTLRGRSALGALVSVTVMLGAGAAAAAPLCWTPDDRGALRSRVLQTDMMVAALNCGLQTEYNAFVRHFSAPMVLRGRALRDMFEEKIGRGYKRSLDKFVTRLANEASMRSMHDQDFCSMADATMNLTASLHPEEFGGLVKTYESGHLHGIPACSGDDAAMVRGGKPGY